MGFALAVLVATATNVVFLERYDTKVTGDIARIMLVAPESQSRLQFADVEAQFASICASFARELEQSARNISQIVISVADRAVPFGQSMPEAQQFFELYDLIEGQCVWRGI